MWYVYDLISESLLLEVFEQGQVSLEDERCPSGGDSNTSKIA